MNSNQNISVIGISHVALVVKNPRDNTGDTRDVGSIPGLGRSPGVESGNPLQYSCLENSMDRKASWATVHGVTKAEHNRATEHTYQVSVITVYVNGLNGTVKSLRL